MCEIDGGEPPSSQMFFFANKSNKTFKPAVGRLLCKTQAFEHQFCNHNGADDDDNDDDDDDDDNDGCFRPQAKKRLARYCTL
jgi:hypothetical protein